MSVRRVENDPEKQALKNDCAALVSAAGGVEAAEGYCRANYRRLSEYGRPDNDVFMPVDVVEDLEAVTHGKAGYPHVSRRLARRAGFALVALPELEFDPAVSLHAALVEHVRDAGEVTTDLCSALGVPSLDLKNTRKALADCDDAIDALMRVKAVLERIAEG